MTWEGAAKVVEYIEPAVSGDAVSAFTCPHCGALAGQEWSRLIRAPRTAKGHSEYQRALLSRCQNANCLQDAVWLDERLIYPDSDGAPAPNPDLPDDVRSTYDEAARVLSRSRRAAGALLRLSIQQLVVHLGQSGENLNKDIGELVKEGLPARVKEALDVVRVIGNNAVHPGEIQVHEEDGTIESLFRLVNFIAEKTITEARELDELHGGLPVGALEAIERRDGG